MYLTRKGLQGNCTQWDQEFGSFGMDETGVWIRIFELSGMDKKDQDMDHLGWTRRELGIVGKCKRKGRCQHVGCIRNKEGTEINLENLSI